MKNFGFKPLFTLVILGIILISSSACSSDNNEEYEIAKDANAIKEGADVIESFGYWSTNDGKIVITEKTVDFHTKAMGFMSVHAIHGEIVEIDNDGFNSGELGEGNFGHAVVKIMEGSTYLKMNGDALHKLVILRWNNLSDSSMKFAFSNADGTKKFGYRDTIEEAKSLTASDGHFEYYIDATRMESK